MRYKSFIGSVNYSTEDEVLYGKIEGINDLVSYEGTNVSDLKQAFQEAADDYIEICKSENRPVFKSYRGSFNVRIKPEMHQKLAEKSLELGLSLNQFVEEALSEKLSSIK